MSNWVLRKISSEFGHGGYYLKECGVKYLGEQRFSLEITLTDRRKGAFRAETYEKAKELAKEIEWLGTFEPEPLPEAELSREELLQIMRLLARVPGHEAKAMQDRIVSKLEGKRDE